MYYHPYHLVITSHYAMLCTTNTPRWKPARGRILFSVQHFFWQDIIFCPTLLLLRYYFLSNTFLSIALFCEQPFLGRILFCSASFIAWKNACNFDQFIPDCMGNHDDFWKNEYASKLWQDSIFFKTIKKLNS